MNRRWAREKVLKPRRIATAGLVLFSVCLATQRAAGTSETASGQETHPALAGLMTAEVARGVVDHVAREVERIRGLEFKQPVVVEVIDDERVKAHLLDRLDRFQLRDTMRWTGEAYRLLGLLPPEMDLLEALLEALEEQAGGFYDPSNGTFYLLDDMPAAMAPVLTAHELTHALEDQHFDLDTRLRAVIHDDDRAFALSAVHEGSAMLLMNTYMIRAVAEGDLGAEEIQAISRAGLERVDAMEALPQVLLRQLLGPYQLGASFLAGGKIPDPRDDFPLDNVNRAFKDGPLSSEQILHPEKFWDADKRDDPRPVDLGRAGGALGRRWHKRADGVLGELSLGVMVGASTPWLLGADAWTTRASTGWGGDRWELWRRGDAAVVLLLTAWDTVSDAEEFAAALPEKASMQWQRSGRHLAIVAGAAGAKTERLLDRMLRQLEPQHQSR